MKNQNVVFIAIAFALAFALAPVTKASPEITEFPMVTIHTTGDVSRGKTGSFVLGLDRAQMLGGGTYVNFSVSGTAIPGVDYVPLVSPAHIGQSGYGVILVKTLRDPRASRQSYSVVITLEPGPGYSLGAPNSATMWIKPCTSAATCQ